MKKIAVGFISLLFLLAGIFGVVGTPQKTAYAEAPSPPPIIPAGAQIWYSDTGIEEVTNQSRRLITTATHDTDLSVNPLFNMRGYIFWNPEASGSVDGVVEVYVEVLRLGAGEPVWVDVEPDYDEENDLEVWYWTFTALGIYEVHIFASVELDDDDSGGDVTPGDDDIVPVIFRVNCKNDASPNFGVRRDDGKITANPQSENFFWDASTALYTNASENLSVSTDNKYMTWQGSGFGNQSITFTVTFNYIAEVDINGETVVGEPSRTETVTTTIFIPRPTSTVEWWHVLIGIAILGGLGVAIWFINKLSKNIEHQQQ